MDASTNLSLLEKVKVAHKHRPRTTKLCFNNNCVITVYCADCGLQLNKYIQENKYEECPIGATDSTEIS